VGGTFEVIARGLPVGLGSCAQWDERLDGQLAQAVMSIQAVKAVEIGSGIASAAAMGASVHDEIGYDRATRALRVRPIAPAAWRAELPTVRTS